MLEFLHIKPNEICTGLRNLFGLPNVQLTNASVMIQVLQWHENGLDFADALHLAQSQNCSVMYTFDDKKETLRERTVASSSHSVDTTG